MGIYFPIPIVVTVLAWLYGKTIRRAWVSAGITFGIVMLSGLVYGGVGQIVGIVISALIIFFAFKLPAQRHAAQEAQAREQDASALPNEEDM